MDLDHHTSCDVTSGFEPGAIPFLPCFQVNIIMANDLQQLNEAYDDMHDDFRIHHFITDWANDIGAAGNSDLEKLQNIKRIIDDEMEYVNHFPD